MICLARKSLTDGDSPRITLRMDNETKKIIADIDKKQRSAFIRKAIVHYASSTAYRKEISTNLISNDNKSNQSKKQEYSSVQHTPVNTPYKPAWQR
jgi:uncharacterized protein (DUF1778 family)